MIIQRPLQEVFPLKTKKIAALLTAISLITLSFSGCGEAAPTEEDTIESIISSEATSEEDSYSDNITTEITIVPESTIQNEQTTETAYVSESITEKNTEVVSDDVGGFNGETVETTTETTEAPPETKITETEAAQAPQVVAPQTQMGAEVTSKYAYNTLTQREQNLYDKILAAMLNLESTVDCESDGYTDAEWNKIFSDVYYQEAEIFWVNPFLETGVIQYKTTDKSEITSMQANIDNMTQQIVNNAASLSNNVDRVKYLHDCIIKMNNFEKSGGTNYSPTIYGGLVLGNIQCEGYAKTFAYLAKKIGLDAIVVTGNVESGASHAWNKVCVDGSWYNIDLTHDDPVLQNPNDEYVRYTYFLVPDSWIEGISHFRTNLSQLYSGEELYKAPAAISADYAYFNYYDKTFDNYDIAYNELLNRIINAANNRKPVVQIKVSNRSLFDSLMDNIIQIKDEAKAATGSPWTRIAADKDENLYIITILLEY